MTFLYSQNNKYTWTKLNSGKEGQSKWVEIDKPDHFHTLNIDVNIEEIQTLWSGKCYKIYRKDVMEDLTYNSVKIQFNKTIIAFLLGILRFPSDMWERRI